MSRLLRRWRFEARWRSGSFDRAVRRGDGSESWRIAGRAMDACQAGRYGIFVPAPDVNTAVNLVEVLP